MKNNHREEYWASANVNEIADSILEKVDNYYEYLQLSGRLNLYLRSYMYYYRPRVTGARLNPIGEQGELTALSVNHYRNFLVHLETMTTQQRPFFEPRATNSDSKSQAQVILAAGLLDYYLGEKKLERNIKQAVKEGLMLSEAYVQVEWDAFAGEKYGFTETGAEIRNGDIKYTNYTVLDVCKDYTKTQANQDDWFILRKFENKWDLISKYPELKDDILSDNTDDWWISSTTFNAMRLDETDQICVFTLLHKPTASIPDGRYTQVLSNGTVLIDGPLPYSKTHVYRLAPDEEVGTSFGYTVGFDLLPVQEAVDALYSTIITNQLTYGVQNVLIPQGSNLNTSALAGGMTVTEYDPKVGKPEAMQLTATPSEIFNFVPSLERILETLSGVNSVVRGNPESSLKSGVSLAIVQSSAIQFSMNLQQSFVQLCEDLGTATIEILKQFAAVPRVAAIAGKANRHLMRQFTGDDFSSIDRVTVDVGNPLTRTTSGKTNIADALLERGMIANPDQYIQVITTGRLEPVIEGKQAELILIKDENEQLGEGNKVRALITDQHLQHIQEHKTVLANTTIRNDPNSPVVVETLAHIQEHIDFLKTTDPSTLALFNQQSIAPQNPNNMPAEQLNATPPAMQQAGEVGEVRTPVNPVTGDQMPIAF